MSAKLSSWVLVLSAAALVTGCGASSNSASSDEDPKVLALTTVSPWDVKANYAGDLLLTGAGFGEDTEVRVNGGSLTSAFPGASAQVLDEWTIRLELSGQVIPHADYALSVRAGELESEPIDLHIRPVLTSLEHVRTLPGIFFREAGFLDIWAMPKDETGAFIGPGHELAPLAEGLGDANFRWETVRITRLSNMTQGSVDIAGVADVKFEPVGTSNPLSVALTIDQSGSMIGLGVNPVPSDPNDERVNQAQAFVQRMGALDEASVIRFQGEAGAVFTVQGFTSDKTALEAGLDTLRETEGGNTPLYDAIIKSVNDLKARPANRTKALILLTDGRDTTSTATSAMAITAARDENIPVFAIGLGNPNDAASLDRADLENIAAQTGGRVFFAEDPSALAGIFDQLTAILADSYRLEAAVSFDPILPAAGSYRIEGDIVADIDGEEIKIPMPAFNVSVLN